MGKIKDQLEAMDAQQFEAWADGLTDEQDTAIVRALAQEYLEDVGAADDIPLDQFLDTVSRSDGFEDALVKSGATHARFEKHVAATARDTAQRAHDMERVSRFWRTYPDAELGPYLEHGDGTPENAMQMYAHAQSQLLAASAQADQAANPRRGTDLMDALDGAFEDGLIGNRGKQWTNPSTGTSRADPIDNAVGSFTEELSANKHNNRFWATQHAAAARDGKPV